MISIEDIVSLVLRYGGVVVSAATASWALFRFLGRKWIEQQFAKELETFRHVRNREIEHFRGEVSALLDRTQKLHGKEFDILPKAWVKLDDAFKAAQIATAHGYQSANLSVLGVTALTEFLGKTPFAEFQKQEILALEGHARQTKYDDLRRRYELLEQRQVSVSAHKYITRNGIFIEPALKAKMTELDDLIWKAITEQELEINFPDPREGRYAQGEKFRAQAPSLHEEIGREVQARLWDRSLLADQASSSGLGAV